MLATSPTTKAELESCSDSHPTAIVCIHDPTRLSVCPIQKIRKWRCRPRMRNGLGLRSAAGDAATVVGTSQYRHAING